MAAAIEASLFASSSSCKFLILSSSKSKPQLISTNLSKPNSKSLPLLSQNLPFSTNFLQPTTRKLSNFERFSTLQELTPQQRPLTLKKKLYVVNLPWSLSVADIKNLFGQCGTVTDVEIIKQKNGKSRGFAFVTMATGEEAQAVVDKFDSHEVLGRIIRVEFAKRLKKPSPPPPPDMPSKETRHKLYVSNLAWKVRSTQLREFFSTGFSPVSSRVVFESPSGRSAGYGFVSFASREEAEAAISTLNGKDLMGRPLRLKFSDRNIDESGSEKQEEENAENQPEQ